MSFSEDLRELISDEFIRYLIIEIGEPLTQRVLNHRIITSLAGRCSNEDELPSAQLERISNKFYIQDYFYLVYAYKVPQLFLKECSTNQDLNKGYTDNLLSSPFLNPLHSNTINQILPYIRSKLKGSRPNSATRKYILSKLDYTFQGDIEAVVSELPCFQLYAKFSSSEIFRESPYLINNAALSEWIALLALREHLDYFKALCRICNNLASGVLSSGDRDQVYEMKKKLIDIYINSWNFELEFFQSLLSE